MNFASPPRGPHGGSSWPAARGLARALIACCALVVLACVFPWSHVAYEGLWGRGSGPPALQTNTGFTCLMTCLLTAMLVAFEGSSRATREAARTGCAFMMAAAALAIVLRVLHGAGLLRGVTAVHSAWFYTAAVAVLGGAWLGWLRWRTCGRPARA